MRPVGRDGESFDAVPEQKRQIGLVSAIFLIFNRIIGTGIFATPSSILKSSGSVGLALFMWFIGAVIASAGLAVYIEWGTVSECSTAHLSPLDEGRETFRGAHKLISSSRPYLVAGEKRTIWSSCIRNLGSLSLVCLRATRAF